MRLAFDPDKDAANIVKHGVSLKRAIDLGAVTISVDDRYAYSETRYRAWGMIDGLPHCLAFTARDGVVRAISLRRTHFKEYRRNVR